MPKDLLPSVPDAPDSSDLLPEVGNTTQWGKIGKDILGDVLGVLDIPTKSAKTGGDFWNESQGIANQLRTDPSRIGKNVLAAGGNVGRNMMNIPENMRKYMMGAGLIPESTPSLAPPEWLSDPNLNLEEYYGVNEPQAGDKLTQNIAKYGSSSLFGGPIVGNTLNAIGEGEGPISSTVESILKKLGLNFGAKTIKGIPDDISYLWNPQNRGGGKINDYTASQGNLRSIFEEYPRSLSQEGTAQDILNNFLTRQGKHQGQYQDIFGTEGLPEESFYFPKSENISTLEKYIPPKTMQKINEHLEGHTPLDLHWAQSELGTIERSLEKKTHLTADENELLKSATEMRKDIKRLLRDTMGVSEDPTLAEIYDAQSDIFRKEIGQPYGPLMEDIGLFKEGRQTPQDFLGNVRGEKGGEFRAMYGHETPGIERAMDESLLQNFGQHSLESIPLLNMIIKAFRGRR